MIAWRLASGKEKGEAHSATEENAHAPQQRLQLPVYRSWQERRAECGRA